MSRTQNPFAASLGANPPLLVGRREAIEDFVHALEDGPGSHERISLIVGARGMGKTVLLNAMERASREQGWLVFSETATPGFVDRLRDQVVHYLRQHEKALQGLNLSFFGVGVGLNWENAPRGPQTYSLRAALTDLAVAQQEINARVHQAPTGIFLTLDEMHYQRSDEVIEFGTTIQHLVREDLDVAVAMAGIPSAIRPLLESADSRNPVTFLRRANRIELHRVSDDDARRALDEPVVSVGLRWDEHALTRAVDACQGYPFMIQLVGQWCFRHAQKDVITVDSVDAGLLKARRKLGQLVHEPSLAELSDVDRLFLAAMAQDEGPSHVSAIGKRLGKSGQYVNNYRRRLVDAEIIVSVGRGEVDFALPYLRDYVREHLSSPYGDADLPWA